LGVTGAGKTTFTLFLRGDEIIKTKVILQVKNSETGKIEEVEGEEY